MSGSLSRFLADGPRPGMSAGRMRIVSGIRSPSGAEAATWAASRPALLPADKGG